jgi:hypothetical protein
MSYWVVYTRKALTGDLRHEFLEADNERDCRNAAMILVDGEIEAIKELDPQLMGFKELNSSIYHYPEPADFLTFGL